MNHHRQYCLNVLSRYGAAPNEGLTPVYESDKDRFTAWLADSLLYAMANELERHLSEPAPSVIDRGM